MQGVRRLLPENTAPESDAPAGSTPEIREVEAVAPQPASARQPAGGVDGATQGRLRRGRVAIEARIDLHGLTQAEAFPALLAFIDSSARAGLRAVLVITGKGAVGQGGGVLRRQTPSWLMASPVAGRILTIAPAHRRHGGDGAFYVILRRERR